MKMERRDFLKFVGASCFGAINAVAGKRLTEAKTPVPKFATGGVVQGKAFRQHDPRCSFVFKSRECGYSGRGSFCFKSAGECELHGNSRNFGGFPPVRKVDIEINAVDAKQCSDAINNASREIARVLDRAYR